MSEIESKYERASQLLEDVWMNIDWEKVDSRRRAGIWNEFEAQIKALSRCYSRLEPFLDKLCKRFDSYLFKKDTVDILKEDHKIYLDIFRYETQIPVLLLRLRREEKKRRNINLVKRSIIYKLIVNVNGLINMDNLRELQKKLELTKIENPDFTEVKRLAKEYIERLKKKDICEDDLNDYDNYFFEAVMEAIYGKDIWEKINPILHWL